MDWISLVPYLLIPIILALLFLFLRRRGKKKELAMSPDSFTVRQPTLFLWVSAIDIVFFGGLTVVMAVTSDFSEFWWIYPVFAVFICIGVYFFLYTMRCRVTVEGDEITIFGVFGPPRTLSFSDITRVRRSPRLCTAYIGKKRAFTVEDTCAGYNLMVERLRKDAASQNKNREGS